MFAAKGRKVNTAMYNSQKITFIVPVYNVEKYIYRCVQSILKQSYSNIEVILVDDGSTDASGEIIDVMASEDVRIKVIHQKNSGVSTARNSGLMTASGEYILFIDGDDYIESDYASYFMGLIVDKNADMAVSLNNFTVSSNEQIINDNRKIWSAEQAVEGIYLDKIGVAVWNKIYKRSVIEEYDIFFYADIWYGEGMLFNIEYLQYAANVAVGERKVYHQIYNPNSAMRRFNLESSFCGLRSLDRQKSVWKIQTPGIEKAWRYHYRNFSWSILCGLISTNAIKTHYNLYRECKKNMRRNILLPWKVDIPVGNKVRLTLFSVFPYICALYKKYKSKKLADRQKRMLEKN